MNLKEETSRYINQIVQWKKIARYLKDYKYNKIYL